MLLLCCLGGWAQAQLPYFHEVAQESGITTVPDRTDLYGNGVAAEDFDGDGDIDFYLPTDLDIPDRLYQNDGQGHFVDVAQELGILETGSSNRAALWMDYNGDQRLDLVVAGENCVNRNCDFPIHLALYEQQADGTFLEVSAQAGLSLGNLYNDIQVLSIGGMASADLNRDHFQDLVISVWGGGVRLFENNGDGTFSDLTEQSGMIMEDTYPWQPMLYDFNGDGWIDIFSNIDFAPNVLWINQHGTFVDQAVVYGLASAWSEMGMAINDYDNDGDLDIYISNITRFFQGEFEHNLLYKQELLEGKVHFREVATGAGVSQSGWDWGTTFLDIDHDGRQDLIATNGWEPFLWEPDVSNMWLNTTAGFVNVSAQCGFQDELSATTLIGFDKDGDGDTDFIQTLKDNSSTQMPLLMYENDLEIGAGENYIRIAPRMTNANHFAIGSVVTLVADDMVSARLISAGCSFYGQEPAMATYGLGARTEIEEIRVRWPMGEVSIYQNLDINQTHVLPYEFIEPPSNLEVTDSDGLPVLSWQDNSDNETGFVLYISQDPTFEEVQEVRVEADQTTYTHNQANQEMNYYYLLRAFNSSVLSDNSNLATQSSTSGPEGPEGLVLVYPNPIISGELTIRSNIPYEGPISFQLVDVLGNTLWLEESEATRPNEEFRFQAGVPAGLYLLEVQMGELKSVQKVFFR